MKTALFDFNLPPERIATQPLSQRDASRMLVVEQQGVHDDFTRGIVNYLRAGDVMIFNDTRVIPARLNGKRGLAGIEVTLLKETSSRIWNVFAKPAKRLSVGDKVIFADDFEAEVVAKRDDGSVDLFFDYSEIMSKLHLHGEMPLPPYMKRDAQSSDKQTYQTVYATKDGAVAAPTAGLHFTDSLLKAIDEKFVNRVHVTLHVGAGTFQPVKVDDTQEHVMHSEYIELTEQAAATLNQARKSGGRIIAVGTTSLRVLESVADDDGMFKPFTGETSIFITPGYKFKAVDVLLTNFHLPRSTLFMLVSAFMGLEVMQNAYKHAIGAQYRFYSYGDACLLIK